MNNLAVKTRYEDFVRELEKATEMQENMTKERLAVLEKIDSIPLVEDSATSDIRRQKLIEKLVLHIRRRIVTEFGGKKSLDMECSTTSLWMLELMRDMIESRWGMSIYNR